MDGVRSFERIPSSYSGVAMKDYKTNYEFIRCSACKGYIIITQDYRVMGYDGVHFDIVHVKCPE